MATFLENGRRHGHLATLDGVVDFDLVFQRSFLKSKKLSIKEYNLEANVG
jgi:hypothetical protein